MSRRAKRPRRLARWGESLCWQQDTRVDGWHPKPMAYCGLIKGHDGPHAWSDDRVLLAWARTGEIR